MKRSARAHGQTRESPVMNSVREGLGRTQHTPKPHLETVLNAQEFSLV